MANVGIRFIGRRPRGVFLLLLQMSSNYLRGQKRSVSNSTHVFSNSKLGDLRTALDKWFNLRVDRKVEDFYETLKFVLMNILNVINAM